MIKSSLMHALNHEHGWRELTETLRPFVARRVRSEVDVDDVMQDIFLKIQRGLVSLRDDQRFGPWVYQIARHAVFDHLRTSARHPAAKDAPAAASPGPEPDVSDDEDQIAQEVAAYAARFVSMLPSPYREALTLTELEGLTQREAAERVGLSLSGMKSRVQRGRQKLRAALEGCCHIALDGRRHVIGCERRPGKGPDGCCT